MLRTRKMDDEMTSTITHEDYDGHALTRDAIKVARELADQRDTALAQLQTARMVIEHCAEFGSSMAVGWLAQNAQPVTAGQGDERG